MQQNNIDKWTYEESLASMLFFAERIDELLFHYTIDSYRCMSVSLSGLAVEYCNVYKDAKAKLINEKNLAHIIEELNTRLQKDPIAEELLSKEYLERFGKNYGSWDTKTQHENAKYIGRKLKDGLYYKRIVEKLKGLIAENKKKEDINQLTTLWVREVLDCGYNENFVYKTLHKIFFCEPVTSLASLDLFFDQFDFAEKKYDVYIGFSKDMTALHTLFEKVHIRDSQIVVMKPEDVPVGIKVRRQRTILKFESIKGYDVYSAFNVAQLVSACVVDSYGFFRHDHKSVKCYGQVIDECREITTIQPKNLLKHRVSALSQEDSERKADALLTALFSNVKNRNAINKLAKIHNSAIYSESTNDSLLSLWSIIESLVDNDEQRLDSGKKKEESETDKKNSRSKIGNVIEYILPFIKSTYIQKLIQTIMDDIIRWDEKFFQEYIATNGFGVNDLEHTFAFITFEATQAARNELYIRTEKYPLLKNRVATLYEQLHNTKNLKALLAAHEQRVKWHFYRIYRARNYIIHDAAGDEKMNYELVINLHAYVDIVISKIVELINNSLYEDTVADVLSEHKLEISIFDEQLEGQSKETISEENALRYLYYDIKKKKMETKPKEEKNIDDCTKDSENIS